MEPSTSVNLVYCQISKLVQLKTQKISLALSELQGLRSGAP